jgi:hypothetical protein
VTSDLELSRLLNATMSRVGKAEVAPVASAFARGFVAAVDRPFAHVRKRTVNAEPTPGFLILGGLDVQVGDHVWYYELGDDRQVVGVIGRDAVSMDPLSTVLWLPPERGGTGTITTPEFTGPDSRAATVDIQTGLTYVPAIEVYNTGSDINWRPVPNFKVNTQTGQLVDSFQCSFRVINTNQTRLAVATYTTEAKVMPAQTYRWRIKQAPIG